MKIEKARREQQEMRSMRVQEIMAQGLDIIQAKEKSH
jgi:hypothetical protein